MREALDAPTEELERMGQAGAAKVAEQHNAAIEAKKLVNLFQKRESGFPGSLLGTDKIVR
jgi:hypothetical protein